MSDGMRRELVYLSSYATNRYFIPNWGRIYYRYADPDYSITEMPLSIEDCKLIKKAIILLENKKDKNNEDTIQVLNKVQDRLKSILNFV